MSNNQDVLHLKNVMIFFLLERYGEVMSIDAASFAFELESETFMCHGHKQIF